MLKGLLNKAYGQFGQRSLKPRSNLELAEIIEEQRAEIESLRETLSHREGIISKSREPKTEPEIKTTTRKKYGCSKCDSIMGLSDFEFEKWPMCQGATTRHEPTQRILVEYSAEDETGSIRDSEKVANND